jgi:hypothetical protein
MASWHPKVQPLVGGDFAQLPHWWQCDAGRQDDVVYQLLVVKSRVLALGLES